MNYNAIYDSIISRALGQLRKKSKHTEPGYVYYEAHHISPRCMGGTDSANNIVLLTAEEHFVAHQLLTRIYPHSHKLIFAAKMLTVNSGNTARNNKLYGWLKRKASLASVAVNTGRLISPETRQRMKDTHTGAVLTQETKDKIGNANRGKSHATGKDSCYYGKSRPPSVIAKMKDNHWATWRKPWDHNNANKAAWLSALFAYDIWVNNGKCGSVKLSRLTSAPLQYYVSIHKHFVRGWNPHEDLSFKNWLSLNT